ncbi:MAG TPA: MarR family transcriptional regulator [Acidimicrobiales bacterium]|nr:MarR family transcriptional regulator [Acidimicrobiales bacterium]
MTLSPDEPYDELRRSIGRLLAADRRLRGREQHRRGGTLSHSHLRALFGLTQQEATAGTLAKVAELNPASVTAMIDQLEGRGLVQRRRDAQDRRQCWISLTDAGRREVEEQERYWRNQMAETLGDISPREIAAATKVLQRIATVMEHLGDVDRSADQPADHPANQPADHPADRSAEQPAGT